MIPQSLFGISGSTNFGTVRVNSGSPLTASVTYVLSNTGGTPYTVNAASTSGDFAITAVNGGTASYPFTVNAGGSASLTVRFDAAAIGTRAGTLSITSNATNTPNYSTALSGFGSEGILAPSWSNVRTQ